MQDGELTGEFTIQYTSSKSSAPPRVKLQLVAFLARGVESFKPESKQWPVRVWLAGSMVYVQREGLYQCHKA